MGLERRRRLSRTPDVTRPIRVDKLTQPFSEPSRVGSDSAHAWVFALRIESPGNVDAAAT